MSHQCHQYKDNQQYPAQHSKESHAGQHGTAGRQAGQKHGQARNATGSHHRGHAAGAQDYGEPHKQANRYATEGKQQQNYPNAEAQPQAQRMSLATVNQSQKQVSNSERPSLSVISSMDYRRPSQNETNSSKRKLKHLEGTRQYQEHSPRGQVKLARQIRSPRDSFGRRRRGEGGYSKSVSISNSRSRKSRQRGYKGVVDSSASSNYNVSDEQNSHSEEASHYREKRRGKSKKVTYGSSNGQSYLIRNPKEVRRDMISGSSSNSSSSSSRESSYRKGKMKYRSQEKDTEYQNQQHGDDPKRKKPRRRAQEEESDVYESRQRRGGKQRSSSMSIQAKRRGKAYSSSEKMIDDADSMTKQSESKYKGQSKSKARGGGSSRKTYAQNYLQDEATINYDNNQNFLYDNRKSKYLSGMSSRQQVKFLMQKTKEETNWVLENDSDIKGGSESSEDDNQQLRDYYGSSEMWMSTFMLEKKTNEDKMKMIRTNAFVQPYIKGIGGTWGTGYQDSYPLNKTDILQIQESNNGNGDSTEPFMVQYEKRMEYMRRKMLHEQRYRLRLLAYSTFQFNPIKQNKFLERKKVIFTKDKARALMCSCQKTKKLSKMLEQKQPQQTNRLQEYLRTRQTTVKTQNNTYNCGEKCFNRGMNCECSLLSCPSDVYCTNRHFQLFQDRFVFPIKTKFKGWGLAAGEFIPKGSFVMQYVGEVFNIDSDLGAQRIQQYKHSTCTYLMRIDNNEVIDPTTSGNIARFINHSCDPNCQTSKWSVLDEVCVGIFAIKDIQEHEELTFDYQFDFFKTPCTRCYCGSKNCKLFLGVATGNQSSGSSSESQSHSSDDNSYKSDYSMKSSANENVNITERPPCFHCKKDIEDTKQLLICKGQCNQLFHVQCAKKLDKALTQQQLQSRKFLCKPCFRIVSGQKKRGRKSNKELIEMMEAKKKELLKGMPIDSKVELPDDREDAKSSEPSIFQDPETQKVMENSLQNLLIDRVVLLLSRKIEVLMAKLFKSRLQNYQKSSLIRSKKFQQQQFSDHYTFMYELIRRLRPKLRKIVDTSLVSKAQQTLADDQGPGGCQISYPKFFKEFPQIASCEEDLEKIRESAGSSGSHQKFLDDYFERFKIGVNELDEDEMMLEELNIRGKCKLSSKKPKRKYVRKSQLLAEAEEKPKKKRGRPPKKMKDDQEENEMQQMMRQLEDGHSDTKNDDVIFISATGPKQPTDVQEDIEQPDSSMVIPLSQVQQRSNMIPEEHSEQEEVKEEVMERSQIDQPDLEDQLEPQDDAASLHDLEKVSASNDKVEPDLQERNDEELLSVHTAGQLKDVVEDDVADSYSNQGSKQDQPIQQDSPKDTLVQQDDDEEPEGKVEDFQSDEEDEENESEQQLESEEGISINQEESEEQESEQENNDSESDQAISSEDEKSQGSDDEAQSGNEESEEDEEGHISEKAHEELPNIEGLKALKPVELPKYDKSKILFQVQQRRQRSKDQTQAHIRNRQKSFDSTAKKSLKQRHSTDRQPGHPGIFGQQSESKHQTKEQIIRQEYRELRQEIADRWEKIIEADIEHMNELRQQHELKAQLGGRYSTAFHVDTKASRLNVNERVFNMVIKNHIDDIECFEHLSIFWEKPWGSNVTLKLVSTRFQYVQISSLLQMCTNRVFSLHSRHRIENTLNQFQIQRIQVPKNFIRKLVGYQERTLQYFRMNLSYDVDFFYNRELLVDEIFPMDDFTHLRIFGRKADVNTVSQMLLNKLESIMMKSILIQKVDCNFVMDNVKEIKCLVDPCEVRIKHSEGPYKDLRHPFLYLPNYLRDIILIGTFDEIRVAERKLQGFLRQKREGQNYMMNQQLSFLLPIYLKDHIERIKLQIRHKHFGVQIFHYMPTYPRKHLTISIIGPWAQIISSKQLLLQLSKPFILQQYRSYEHFQGQVFHQQIRFAFKSLKRYILEKDIKYLSHWDIVSVFVDNIGKDFKLDLNEDDIEMLIKQKQREMNDSNADQASKGYEVAAVTTVNRSQHTQQESFLDALLQSDQEEEDNKQEADDAEKQASEQPKNEDDVLAVSAKMQKSSSLHLPQVTSASQLAVQFRQNSWNIPGDGGNLYQIDKEALIQKHIDEIQAMRQNEILQLKNYLRDDDPESCINILFVLSQCKSQEHSSHSRKKQRDSDQEEIKDELFSLMQRLDIKKFQLVKYMQQVLNNNLNKFMHSLGKSKNHVKQFESDSSTSQEIQKDSASNRKSVQVVEARRRSSKERNLKDSKKKRSRQERKSDSNSKSSKGPAREDEIAYNSRRKKRISLSRERSPEVQVSKRQLKLERKMKESDSRHLKYHVHRSGQKRVDKKPSRERSRSLSSQKDSQGRYKGREVRDKYSRHSIRKHGEKSSKTKTYKDLMVSKYEPQTQKIKRVIIRDGEDFIIKNNQQIPRFGFSKSIERDEEAHQPNNPDAEKNVSDGPRKRQKKSEERSSRGGSSKEGQVHASRRMRREHDKRTAEREKESEKSEQRDEKREKRPQSTVVERQDHEEQQQMEQLEAEPISEEERQEERLRVSEGEQVAVDQEAAMSVKIQGQGDMIERSAPNEPLDYEELANINMDVDHAAEGHGGSSIYYEFDRTGISQMTSQRDSYLRQQENNLRFYEQYPRVNQRDIVLPQQPSNSRMNIGPQGLVSQEYNQAKLIALRHPSDFDSLASFQGQRPPDQARTTALHQDQASRNIYQIRELREPQAFQNIDGRLIDRQYQQNYSNAPLREAGRFRVPQNVNQPGRQPFSFERGYLDSRDGSSNLPLEQIIQEQRALASHLDQPQARHIPEAARERDQQERLLGRDYGRREGRISRESSQRYLNRVNRESSRQMQPLRGPQSRAQDADRQPRSPSNSAYLRPSDRGIRPKEHHYREPKPFGEHQSRSGRYHQYQDARSGPESNRYSTNRGGSSRAGRQHSNRYYSNRNYKGSGSHARRDRRFLQHDK